MKETKEKVIDKDRLKEIQTITENELLCEAIKKKLETKEVKK